MKRGTLTLALLLLLVSGCGGTDSAKPAAATDLAIPAPGDTAIVRLETEADSLNPIISATANASAIMFGANNSHVFESLLQQETSDWVTPKPLLSETRPEISADHLIYIFPLRQGVAWHDGKPFTPEDALFTLKVLMTPGVDSGRLRGYLASVTDIDVVDGKKLRFTLSQPYFMNESALGANVAIVAKHVFDPQGVLDGFTYKDLVAAKNQTNPKLLEFGKAFNSNPAARAPIGTGPFKFEKWDTGKEVVVARNDQYWGTKPWLAKVVYRFITDGTAALTALKSGEIDFNARLLPIQFSQQTSGPAFDDKLEKKPYTLPQYYYIGWNEDRPYFKDKRVRQALTMLLNREQMVEKVRFGLGIVATSHFNPGSGDYNPNLKPLPYDPKKAAELLDEAGWKDSNGDGIRDKDGKPFSFEFLTTTSEFSNQLSAIVKEEFRKAGIDVKEKHLEGATFQNTMRDRAFDAEASGWASNLITDPYQIWHSSSIANRGSNVIGFRNKESDTLIEQARMEFDVTKRRALFWKWQELIADEQPYTFLFYPQESAAYSKRLQNVKFIPSRPGYDLNTIYVPASQQKYK